MILDLSPAENSAYQEKGRLLFAGRADFMLGVAEFSQLPDLTQPEIAFIGRSNVGKSSLINALLGRKNLARASNTPGRTQQINFFKVADKFRIADLPGYGFANAPENVVAKWTELINSYLKNRPTLCKVLVLIDSRRGLKDSDVNMMAMLDNAAVPYMLVVTKADKVGKAELKQTLDNMMSAITSHPACYPNIVATSSNKKLGIPELQGDITYFLSAI